MNQDSEDRARESSDADHAAEDRDRTAEDRDQRAEAHDEASEERDARAAARDERAAAREDAGQGSDSGAAADRAGALRDRRGGASDRTQAADDREAASADRVFAAEERATLSVDQVTGVYRREIGLVLLEREMIRARRTDQPFAIAFADVDGLKAVNDSLGHAAGDRLLRGIADTITSHLREYDVVMRYGGDEFLCGLLDLTAPEAAARFAAVNADLGTGGQASVSVGVSEYGADDTLEALVARADEAMYRDRRIVRRAAG